MQLLGKQRSLDKAGCAPLGNTQCSQCIFPGMLETSSQCPAVCLHLSWWPHANAALHGHELGTAVCFEKSRRHEEGSVLRVVCSVYLYHRNSGYCCNRQNELHLALHNMMACLLLFFFFFSLIKSQPLQSLDEIQSL